MEGAVTEQQPQQTTATQDPEPMGPPRLGPGDAPVKAEYLIARPLKRSQPDEPASAEASAAGSDDVNKADAAAAAPSSAKQGKYAAKRGRKEAARQRKERAMASLCDKIAIGLPCPRGDTCRFSHDVAAFLAAKPADIGPVCPVFEKTGRCPQGLKCRFGGAHIKDGANVVREPETPLPPLMNMYTRELQERMRNRKGSDWKRADDIVAERLRTVPSNRGDDVPETPAEKPTEPSAPEGAAPAADVQMPAPDAVVPADEAVKPAEAAAPVEAILAKTEEQKSQHLAPLAAPEQTGLKAEEPQAPATAQAVSPLKTGIAEHVETRLLQCEKKRIDWRGKTYLAPLTTVGNLPFRRVCKGLGVDITVGEMAIADNLLTGSASEWALLRRHPCEDIFGVQLAGSYPNKLAHAAQLIEDEGLKVDFVDLNAGCPIDLVCDRGMCAALLDKPSRMGNILWPMSRILSCPLTLKIRTGRSEKSPTVLKNVIPHLAEWGVDSAVLHGRSRQQRYSRSSDWDYISRCAAASPVPILGNGDVFAFEDWDRALKTGVASCTIARAALIKPWIFTEIKERRHWDISSRERLDLLKTYVGYGLEHWGSDDRGVETTRQFTLEWLSFLHRYVPVGLLEVLPAKVSDRPPAYRGRDDLETLFASDKSTDWVKITEMLLGPAPESFKFVPKHKSNS